MDPRTEPPPGNRFTSQQRRQPEFQAFVWLEAGWHAQERPGKGADAVHDFREATRLKPGSRDRMGPPGAAYEALGQYDKAISAYQEAIRLNPDDEGAWISLGYAERRTWKIRQGGHASSKLLA